jgi:hypothetical protein
LLWGGWPHITGLKTHSDHPRAELFSLNIKLHQLAPQAQTSRWRGGPCATDEGRVVLKLKCPPNFGCRKPGKVEFA